MKVFQLFNIYDEQVGKQPKNELLLLKKMFVDSFVSKK